MRKLVLLLTLAIMATLIVSCDGMTEAERQEKQAQQNNYTGLQSKQPTEAMDYSPTRDGINKWMATWEEPGKLSYVYLMGASGNLTGYYILEGLPVSYCASLTPPDQMRDTDEGEYVVTAPAMDGVYYSGGQCNQYYGYDATTGAYIEFSIGGSQNYLLYDQPLPRQDVEPLGFTTIEEAQHRN